MKNISELRWDPLLGEWVLVSNLRTFRPWLPSTACPFCPGSPETGQGWKALILKNKFPMLSEEPPSPSRHVFYKTDLAEGACFVVVETPEHSLDDLSDLPINHITYVLELIKDKAIEASTRSYAKYFLWFRNKGVEIGVSLTHPHSQIYVTPFIPVKIEREIDNSRRYYERVGKCIHCEIISQELMEWVRVIYKDEGWVAFTPFYARWPFEVHIYPLRHVSLLTELNRSDLAGLSKALKTVLCGLKNVFKKKPMPYVFVLHQSPLNEALPYYHLHVEIYGMGMDEDKLKHAAGMELGGGNFTYDSTPELNALTLRKTVGECLKE